MSRFKFFLVNELHEQEIDEFFSSNKIIKWSVTNSSSGIPTLCIQYTSRLFNSPNRLDPKPITDEDVELVATQCNVSTARAKNALILSNGDLANAIMSLMRQEE